MVAQSVRNEWRNKQMNEMLMNTDTLDMAGDWKLTYGYTVGLTTDDTPAAH